MKKLFAILLLCSLSLPLSADPGLIMLANAVIDPSSPKIAGAETIESSPTADGKYQFIVQPEKNFSSAELKELKELGFVKIGVIPPNAYIFLASKDQIKELGEIFPLLYCGEYKPEYKIVSLGFQKRIASTDASEKVLLGLATLESYDSVAEFLKAQNVGEFKLLHSDPPVVEAKIPLSLVPDLSKLSGVSSIEPKAAKKFMNDVARSDELMNVDRVNNSGYTGKDVMVVVADTGLDSGDIDNIHDDFRNKNVIGVLAENNKAVESWRDIHGHGTHVSGSATGSGAHENGKYAGTARDADLYFIRIMDESYGLVDLQDADFQKAYRAGGRVMNNSWGSVYTGFKGEYNSEAKLYDTLSGKYPDFLILFAAGNENYEFSTRNNCTLGMEAVAKNSVTVGAAESYHPEFTTTYGQLYGRTLDSSSPYYNDKIGEPYNQTQQGMACFSSRGPAKDGRAKPDIAAPGTFINSVEALYDDVNQGERKSYYTYDHGTSMASPLTAGSAACVLQYLKENIDISSPSSALIKAVLINGARNMGKGQFTNRTEIPEVTPNCVNGFGHVNLNESLDPSCGELFAMEGTIEETGKAVSYFFTKESEGPVSATLCWTDYPGTVGAQLALVNDLDIVVSDGENEYYSGGQSESNDHINNIERCQVGDFPTDSIIEIRVSGVNIMEGPQAFALCVSGVDEVVPEPASCAVILIFMAFFTLARARS